MNNRRAFITLFGGAAATWPLAARAQQAGKIHRIGFLGSATAAGSAKEVESLRTGLHEFGYVERTNILLSGYRGENRTTHCSMRVFAF